MNRWRHIDLLYEAFSNTIAQPSRIRWFLPILVACAIAFTAFRLVEFSGLDAKVDELSTQGRNIVMVQSFDPLVSVEIDQGSCEALTKSDGIDAAGVLVQVPPKPFPQLGNSVTVFMASPALFPAFADADVLIGANLLNYSPGTKLAVLQDGQALRAEVLERAPNGVPVNSAVLYSLNRNESFSASCLVMFDQRQDLSSALPGAIAQLNVHSGNVAAFPVLSSTRNPFSEYLSRPTQHLPVAVGILLGLMLAIATRLRASEIATYRLSGTSQRGIATLMYLEAVWVGTTYLGFGCLTAVALLQPEPMWLLTVCIEHLIAASAIVLTASIFSISLARRSPMDLAKER